MGEKSGFKFIKTRFDWEKLDRQTYNFLFMRSSFEFFFREGEGEQRRFFFTLVIEHNFENVSELGWPPI